MPQSDFWPFKSMIADDVSNGGASVLQKQLGDMEGEVKEIQMELAALRKDRISMHPRKRTKGVAEDDVVKDKADETFSKLTEVSKLREDLIRAKNSADEERFQREKYENKLRELEGKINGLCCTGLITAPELKNIRQCSDDETMSLKNQIRDLREELEDTKLSLNDKNDELQEYRLKYLQAQQQVEELRRQLEVVDFENKQVSEQVQTEIQRMKIQFQEKLHELEPLPDLLNGAQIELQEAKQLQRLAEENSQQVSDELQRVKDKLVVAVGCLNKEKSEKLQISEENKILKTCIEEKQKEFDELTVNLDDHKCSVLRLQEKLKQQENRFVEKSKECAELLKDLEDNRQETSRTLNRNKDRVESMRRSFQTQIAELERLLVHSRAQCRASQKDRDEARQRIQTQVNSLQESFEMVELRLRTLQGQVNSMKNTYAVILSGENDNKISN